MSDDIAIDAEDGKIYSCSIEGKILYLDPKDDKLKIVIDLKEKYKNSIPIGINLYKQKVNNKIPISLSYNN